MRVDSRCALVSVPTLSRRSCLCFAYGPRKPPRFGPNGSPRANDPMLPSRNVPRAALRSALGYLLLPLWGGRIGSRPEARGQRPEARGGRREARGNNQTAGKLWCDPQQVSKDHAKRGDCPRVFLMVRRCFYPSSQGDPAYVSLAVLENRPDLGRTVRPVRTIQCSRRASVPRAALRSALGYLLLPLWGRRIGSRPEARGKRPEGTAKQPENFGAILRRYPRITQNAGTVPGYFSAWKRL